MSEARKEKSRTRIPDDFFRGDHHAVLAQTVDAPATRDRTPRSFRKQLRYVIGSLAFLGRLEEAQALFDSHPFETEEAAAARFFLGVGYCRLSRYAESRQLLFENLRQARRSPDPLLQFHAYQGLGFYRFFCGRFGAALASARKANLAALESGFLWGKLLSSDLMGHALVQTGEISLGLRTLEQGLGHARHLGDGGVRQAIRVALACYQAQFGLKPEALAELEALGRELADRQDEDTYSRAALLLEQARQYGLRGELERAREALSQSSRHIYGSRNRRQSVLLNIRYAQLHFLQGQPEQALNLLLNSDRELVLGVDNALEVEALGVKLKILRATGIDEHPGGSQAAIERRIRFLTQYTGKLTSKRILRRDEGRGERGESAPALGEDPVGDLIDRLGHPDPELHEEFVRRGYFGLFYEALPVPRAARALYADVLPDRLLVFDHGSVSCARESLTPILRKLLRALGAAPEVSKEELIRSIWGYRYHPLQHDPLIYSTVSRARQILGARDFWIQATENGYRLRQGVEARFYRVEETAPAGGAASRPGSLPDPVETPLNSRQIKLLRYLETVEFVGVKECMRLFQVSEITASRDLSFLTSSGALQRVGRGRATRYRAYALRSP